MSSSLDEFVQTLHAEKLNTMAERSKYARDKIIFIFGMLGVGSLGLSFPAGQYSNAIVYLVPLVAIGYDLYINAYNEGIKRIGAFMRKQECDCTPSEKEYENYVTTRRGYYAPLANVLFSLIGTFGAAIVVLTEAASPTGYGKIIQILWFIVLGLVIVMMYHLHRKHMKSFDDEK